MSEKLDDKLAKLKSDKRFNKTRFRINPHSTIEHALKLIIPNDDRFIEFNKMIQLLYNQSRGDIYNYMKTHNIVDNNNTFDYFALIERIVNGYYNTIKPYKTQKVFDQGKNRVYNPRNSKFSMKIL